MTTGHKWTMGGFLAAVGALLVSLGTGHKPTSAPPPLPGKTLVGSVTGPQCSPPPNPQAAIQYWLPGTNMGWERKEIIRWQDSHKGQPACGAPFDSWAISDMETLLCVGYQIQGIVPTPCKNGSSTPAAGGCSVVSVGPNGTQIFSGDCFGSNCVKQKDGTYVAPTGGCKAPVN